MSQCYVYKTKKKQIVTVILGVPDDEGTSKITVMDSNIPPSEANLIGVFEADAQCDYIVKMIPILLAHLPEDKKLEKMIKQISKEGL